MRERRIGSWLFGSTFIALVLVVVTVLFAGKKPDASRFPNEMLDLAALLVGDEDGFESATGGWDYRFPRDHGTHPGFRTEYWSVTGAFGETAELETGFQFALARLALSPTHPERESHWATNQVYRATLALADRESGRFEPHTRTARAALGLAGITENPLGVRVETWSLEVVDAAFRLVADGDDWSLMLRLDTVKPILDSDTLAAGSPGTRPAGLAYYLIPRLAATGTLTRGGHTHQVTGYARLEHTWGGVPTDRGQVVFDRFAVHLDDGRDLDCVRTRRRDGSGTPIPDCILVEPDGGFEAFARRDIALEPVGEPNAAGYPIRWRLDLPELALTLTLEPFAPDAEQFLVERLWSGPVAVSGSANGEPVGGSGHMELRGYARNAPIR